MDFMSIVGISVSTALAYAVPFLVALTVIVFIHELGHFLVARWCGVAVDVFSIGFGREIFGWNDRHGTRWKLAWLPLGGYVKFRGDSNAASLPDSELAAEAAKDPGNFHGKPLWQRAAVVIAGPLANFILAIAIFAVGAMLVGIPVAEPRAGDVLAGSAAEKAGIKPGDLILRIDGSEVGNFLDIQRAVLMRPGEEVVILLERQGSEIEVKARLDDVSEDDGMGGKVRKGRLGVSQSASAMNFEQPGVWGAISFGADQTWFIVESSLKYLGKIITGHESGDQLRGPVGIAEAAGYAASNGPYSFIGFIAFISAAIGLINLFPIPMLDGGHLVFYGIEAVRGKPLGPMAQEWGFRIGFSLLLLLMIVATSNDIMRKLF